MICNIIWNTNLLSESSIAGHRTRGVRKAENNQNVKLVNTSHFGTRLPGWFPGLNPNRPGLASLDWPPENGLPFPVGLVGDARRRSVCALWPVPASWQTKPGGRRRLRQIDGRSFHPRFHPPFRLSSATNPGPSLVSMEGGGPCTGAHRGGEVPLLLPTHMAGWVGCMDFSGSFFFLATGRI